MLDPRGALYRCSAPVYAHLFLCCLFASEMTLSLSQKPKKWVQDEEVHGLKHRFIQQVFAEHLPRTKDCALISQKSAVRLLQATLMLSRDRSAKVKAGFLQYKWGCMKHQTLMHTNKWWAWEADLAVQVFFAVLPD